jgi:uncharacterized protein Veg
VSKGGSFEITYSSASANIKYVTFGYSRALTAVVKITYEQ